MSKLEDLLEEMAGVDEPFGLFEPQLWYGKLGDEGWICTIRSTHMVIWEGKGATALEAVQNCMNEAKKDRSYVE